MFFTLKAYIFCTYFERGREDFVDGGRAPPGVLWITGLWQGDDHRDGHPKCADKRGDDEKRAYLSDQGPVPRGEKVVADARVVVERQWHIYRTTIFLSKIFF